MNRKLHTSLALALVAAFALVRFALAAAQPSPADILYFENGVIYTADPGDTVAEALAVQDGKILFTGTLADGKAYKDKAAKVVDLQGKMLMPGLIDGHIHSVSPSFFDFDLVGLTTAEDTLATIRAHVEGNPDRETYFGFGYLAPVFEGDEMSIGPRKELLDEICPEKPIVIYSFDGHAAWLNSKAFEYCGITRDTESTPGGEIQKDDNGELWGILNDTAMSFTADFPLDQEKLPFALKAYVLSLNAMGYTSIFSPPGNGFFPVPWAAYQTMADNHDLTLRVRGAGLITSWQTEKDLASLALLKETYRGDLLSVTGGKFFVDGVADNQSAYLLEPYADDPADYGVAGWEPEALNQAVTAVNRLGLLAHLHSMGDAATRMALDAVEYAQGQLGKADVRNALTHLQLVTPGDFSRFHDLGVIAVANPFWHYKAPYYWEPVEYASLGQRANKEYPMKSFLDSDVVLAFASDYPVTAKPSPFVAIETGVTRNIPEDTEYGLPDISSMDDPSCLLWPEERLSVTQMLRGYTIDGAYSLFAEDMTGSLEVGKSADMIVINQNLFTINPLDISKTQVLQTYFQGQLVYQAE